MSSQLIGMRSTLAEAHGVHQAGPCHRPHKLLLTLGLYESRKACHPFFNAMNVRSMLGRMQADGTLRHARVQAASTRLFGSGPARTLKCWFVTPKGSLLSA